MCRAKKYMKTYCATIIFIDDYRATLVGPGGLATVCPLWK